MSRGKDQADFILLGNFAGELDAIAQFEFGIAVVIKGKCGRPVPKGELGVEQKRIFINDLAFVASLRNFDRGRKRPAVTEQIALAKLSADDSTFKCAVAEREADFLALGFFGGDIQEKHVFVGDRSRLNLQDIEKAGPHQRSKTLVQSFGTVSLGLQSGEPLPDEARAQCGQAVDKNFATEVIE